MQLDALDQIDQLRKIVSRLGPANGRAYSWQLVVARGLLAGIPLDPSRTPYAIDPATGRVSVSPESPLSPMPEEAGPTQ